MRRVLIWMQLYILIHFRYIKTRAYKVKTHKYFFANMWGSGPSPFRAQGKMN